MGGMARTPLIQGAAGLLQHWDPLDELLPGGSVKEDTLKVGIIDRFRVVPLYFCRCGHTARAEHPLSLVHLQTLLTPEAPTIQAQPELRLGLGELRQPVQGPVVGRVGQQGVVVLVWRGKWRSNSTQ